MELYIRKYQNKEVKWEKWKKNETLWQQPSEEYLVSLKGRIRKKLKGEEEEKAAFVKVKEIMKAEIINPEITIQEYEWTLTKYKNK